MKYVMFVKRRKLITEYVPIIFCSRLVHKSVAEGLLKMPEFEGFSIHSAGEISPLDLRPYGKSVTLNLEHDPDDYNRILMSDYGAGLE